VSTQPLDFSDLGAKPVSKPLDFSDLGGRPVSTPSVDKPKMSLWEQGRQSYEAQKNLPVNQRTQSNLGSSFEGHPENIGEYGVATGGRAAEGAVDISRGNYAMGANKLLQAGGNAIAPMAPLMAASAPVMAARAVAGGYVGQKVAGAGAQIAGATPDQQALSENLGNLVGGFTAASGLPRALLQTPIKNLIAKNPEMLETMLKVLEPRKTAIKILHEQLGKALDVQGASTAAAAETGIADPAEVLKAGGAAPQAGFNDTTQTYVRPNKMGTPQGIQDMLAAAKAGEPVSNRVDAHKVSKTAIGQAINEPAYLSQEPPAPAPKNPKLEMPVVNPDKQPAVNPNRPTSPDPDALAKANRTIKELRDWQRIRDIHDQIEKQLGAGQEELNGWIKGHNQQAAGSEPSLKPTEYTPGAAKGKPQTSGPSEATLMSEGEADVPRVPQSDSDIETLLMKSLRKYGFQHDPATGKMVKISGN